MYQGNQQFTQNNFGYYGPPGGHGHGHGHAHHGPGKLYNPSIDHQNFNSMGAPYQGYPGPPP